MFELKQSLGLIMCVLFFTVPVLTQTSRADEDDEEAQRRQLERRIDRLRDDIADLRFKILASRDQIEDMKEDRDRLATEANRKVDEILQLRKVV